MSVSLWAYKAENCDGEYCCGDCDFCKKTNENLIEEDEDETGKNDGNC